MTVSVERVVVLGAALRAVPVVVQIHLAVALGVARVCALALRVRELKLAIVPHRYFYHFRRYYVVLEIRVEEY